MRLYHCTTPHKLERYKNTGRIISPVRGWRYLNSAKSWCKKTQRSIIVQFDCETAYPLPDHKPMYHSYWTPEDIKNYEVIDSNHVPTTI